MALSWFQGRVGGFLMSEVPLCTSRMNRGSESGRGKRGGPVYAGCPNSVYVESKTPDTGMTQSLGRRGSFDSTRNEVLCWSILEGFQKERQKIHNSCTHMNFTPFVFAYIMFELTLVDI